MGGCATQLLKLFVGVLCLFLIVANIGMILSPILKLYHPISWENEIYFKIFLKDPPMYVLLIFSAVSLSIWYLTYKLKKFENLSTGVIMVGVFTFVYAYSAGFILNSVKTFLGIGAGIIAALYPIHIAIVLITIDVFKKRKKIENLNKNTKFAKSENDDSLNFKTNKGIITLQNPFRGIYIQGGAGSGKSASIFEPIIKQIALQGYSGILYDFKSPELTNKARFCYSEIPIKFRNIDFKNPNTSDRINPIAPHYLNKSVIAIEYAQALVNNLIPESIKKSDFWSNNTKMIIAGVIWWLKEEHPKYCTLPHVISLLLHTDIKLLLLKISQNYEAGGMVSTLKQSLQNEAQNQVAGILSTIQTALAQLNTKDIFWILSGNDVDLNLNNPENPCFLSIGNDSTLPQVYAPIISLIISVGIRQMNKPNQNKSVVLLDEAPTIYIPNIEQLPATARSNKIATIFGVQDFSQLVDNYGQDKAQIIISNLGNQFFGRVTNGKTAEMVKELFSKEDRIFINKNKGSGSGGTIIHTQTNINKGLSESIQERDRVKINDLINLEPGEFYGIIAEGTPKEFLKTQFNQDVINGINEQKNYTTDEQMNRNYFEIIEQSKLLLE